MDLGDVDESWRGFKLHKELIWTPEGYNVGPNEVRSIPYRIEEIHELRREMKWLVPTRASQIQSMQKDQLLEFIPHLRKCLSYAIALREELIAQAIKQRAQEARKQRQQRRLELERNRIARHQKAAESGSQYERGMQNLRRRNLKIKQEAQSFARRAIEQRPTDSGELDG